jgi:hypothetical protein
LTGKPAAKSPADIARMRSQVVIDSSERSLAQLIGATEVGHLL